MRRGPGQSTATVDLDDRDRVAIALEQRPIGLDIHTTYVEWSLARDARENLLGLIAQRAVRLAVKRNGDQG